MQLTHNYYVFVSFSACNLIFTIYSFSIYYYYYYYYY